MMTNGPCYFLFLPYERRYTTALPQSNHSSSGALPYVAETGRRAGIAMYTTNKIHPKHTAFIHWSTMSPNTLPAAPSRPKRAACNTIPRVESTRGQAFDQHADGLTPIQQTLRSAIRWYQAQEHNAKAEHGQPSRSATSRRGIRTDFT